MKIPSREKLLKGITAFEKREKRDAMYRVASFLISHFWGKPTEMADGLGVLLLTWNQASYRYGSFDFGRLEKCIANKLGALKKLRKRDIVTMSPKDEVDIKELFSKFLDALTVWDKKPRRRGYVATAKALHLLAPRFFPLWDYEIARAYRCNYYINPSQKYLEFCWKMKEIAERVKSRISRRDKTLLKLIDEYNFARYTKGWI